MFKISLKIADIIIRMQSKFFLQPFDFKKKWNSRLRNFLYQGRKVPQILIDVNIVKELPRFPDAKTVFIAYHFQDGPEDWHLLKNGDYFIYKSPPDEKRQPMLMVINRYFNKVDAYLLPKKITEYLFIEGFEEKERLCRKHKGFLWDAKDIVYGFLQILLINYLMITKRDGIFIHGMGVKDINKQGLLFVGKSNSGKTSLAKIYHKYSNALVLSDDRIIVRKINNKFYIYGSPWYGEFSDYLESLIDRAELKSIFFLQKSKENSIKPIHPSKAFKFLYTVMFPTFWDKEGTERITMFLTDLLTKTPYFRLKFEKDKSVIAFVRK